MSKGNKSAISEKMERLDELVAWFEGDDFELERALEMFTEAKKLADEIEQNLAEIKNTITVINEQFDRDVS